MRIRSQASRAPSSSTGLSRRAASGGAGDVFVSVGQLDLSIASAKSKSLLSSWRGARNGVGQLVFMTGEPGIGKSRLVEEFRSRLRDTHIWMECAGERFAESAPFHTATKLLEQALDLEKDESAEVRMRRLKRALRSSGLDLSVTLPLIAEMLKLPASQEKSPSQDRARAGQGLPAYLPGRVDAETCEASASGSCYGGSALGRSLQHRTDRETD